MIGKRAEFLRTNMKPKLSQEGLGEKVGVSQSTISRLEKNKPGKRDLGLLKRLAAFFDVPLEFFLEEDLRETRITVTWGKDNNVVPQFQPKGRGRKGGGQGASASR
jgi:transcriptional regulator with XRE-family HTH domain